MKEQTAGDVSLLTSPVFCIYLCVCVCVTSRVGLSFKPLKVVLYPPLCLGSAYTCKLWLLSEIFLSIFSYFSTINNLVSC